MTARQCIPTVALAMLGLTGCAAGRPGGSEADPLAARRAEMVERQMRQRGITDERVLQVMNRVPRHRFVPPMLEELAYSDRPLPIGLDQTISQPYMVAAMTEQLDLQPGQRVLEVGTGSGYQAAILAELGAEVYTIELLPQLGRQAATRLRELGYTDVHCRIGDGYLGWPEAAPFDAIIVTAAPPEVPPALLTQLAPGGRMVVPVGRQGQIQQLLRLEKDAEGQLHRRSLMPVRFVPMVPGEDRSP